MNKKRIVITGMGVVCAVGNDIASFRHALFNNVSGIGAISLFDTSLLKVKIAGEVKNFVAEQHFSPAHLSLLDRYNQFSLVAARQAVHDAGIVFREPNLSVRSGVFHGTGIGGQTTMDESYQRLYGENKSRFSPSTVLKGIPSSATSQLLIEFGIKGPGMTTATACSASGHALALAIMMLRSGMIDAALVGGAEAPLTLGALFSWEAMRVLALDTCRPFSKGRTGTVLGEGSGMLVLETLEHAQARGATIHAELLGVGISSDAYHAAQPDKEGVARTIQLALDDAQISANAVDYINAHGTATQQNDWVESAAIRQVFGTHANKLAVSSTKSAHAHLLGASSSVELIATVLALQEQIAPPTLNYLAADSECDLDYVTHATRPMPMNIALSQTFAFGGMNVVLAIGRSENI